MPNEEAVSSLLAAVILILITLVISLAAYSVASGYVSVSSTNVQVSVSSMSLLASQQTVVFSVTIINSGSVEVTGITLSISGNMITNFHYAGKSITGTNPLPAGLNTTYTSSTLSGIFEVGSEYAYEITTSSNAGTFVTSGNVFCEPA